VDNTTLIFKDTNFTKNSCYDGCLVHNDGLAVRLSMESVVATDNWAYQTASLVFVEQTNETFYKDNNAYVKIKYS
jgi:hypothetical protein